MGVASKGDVTLLSAAAKARVKRALKFDASNVRASYSAQRLTNGLDDLASTLQVGISKLVQLGSSSFDGLED